MEERLLHEYMRTIKNEFERKELHDAYIMRRHRLSRMPEEADMLSESRENEPKPKRIDPHEITKTIKTIDGTGIRYHDYSDIGKYTVFPAQYKNRVFPSGAYGRIEQDDVAVTRTLGVMCREQGLRITNELARMTLPQDRDVEYGRIAHEMTNTQVRQDLLSDDVVYTALVQDMALALHDYIIKHERKNELKKFFLAPGVFDGLVNVLVRELAKRPIRPHICDE
mmetsp:Transcript_20791/g.24416  ORF Transcript_20791/g.24416 Transcript_20791/m.24416 type:complete len:224 (+) Transcript_20791:321-992(+)